MDGRRYFLSERDERIRDRIAAAFFIALPVYLVSVLVLDWRFLPLVFLLVVMPLAMFGAPLLLRFDGTPRAAEAEPGTPPVDVIEGEIAAVKEQIAELRLRVDELMQERALALESDFIPNEARGSALFIARLKRDQKYRRQVGRRLMRLGIR